MMSRKSGNSNNTSVRPALTPEARQVQMTAMAEELAYEQLMNGTASSQIITHYLKLGSERVKLENEKLKQENELLKEKTAAIKSEKRSEELYSNAIKAFSKYSGRGDLDPDENI